MSDASTVARPAEGNAVLRYQLKSNGLPDRMSLGFSPLRIRPV